MMLKVDPPCPDPVSEGYIISYVENRIVGEETCALGFQSPSKTTSDKAKPLRWSRAEG